MAFGVSAGWRWAGGALIAAVLGAAGTLVAPGRAVACTPSPTPTFTIADIAPRPGSVGVARDAAIMVAGVPSLGGGWLFPFADLTLVDVATEEAVPLADARWLVFRGSDVVLALHPLAPLAPLHTYRAEARVRAGFAGGSSSSGSGNGSAGGEGSAPAVVSEFTTSEALLDPLVLNGELEFSLRGAEVDVVEPGVCGPGSRVIGQRRALFADVELPVPSGAQGLYGAVLYFSDDAPLRINPYDSTDYDEAALAAHQVYEMQAVQLQAGQALVLEQEVLERDFGYAGCFTLVVTDPSGQVAQASRCLPSLSPGDARALSRLETPLPVSIDAAAAAEDVRRAADEHRDEAGAELGCMLAPAAPATTHTPAWLIALLGALATTRAQRRRHGRR